MAFTASVGPPTRVVPVSMAERAASPEGIVTDFPWTVAPVQNGVILGDQHKTDRPRLRVMSSSVHTCHREHPKCRRSGVRKRQELDVARKQGAVRSSQRQHTAGLFVRGVRVVQVTVKPERELRA